MRNFLRWIRMQHARIDGGLSIFAKALIAFLCLLPLGIIVDIYFPFNPILNIFRSAIALGQMLSLFIAIYVLSIINQSARQQKENYIPLRKRFSYNQRFNMGVTLAIVNTLWTLTLIKQNARYTFLSGISLLVFMGIIAFVRKTRSEHLREASGLPDVRDLAFERRAKLKRELEANSSNQKDDKENKKSKRGKEAK